MHYLGRDAAALAAFKADQAVAFHRSQRARQVRLGLAGDTSQFVERARRLLGDDAQQVTISGGEDLGERLGRGEPNLGLIGRHTPLATRHGHGAGLHLVVAGDADLQRRHGITPLSCNTASTVSQKSASKVAASWYS